MSATAPIPARLNRTTPGLVGLAFAAAVGMASVAALSHDDSPARSGDAPVSTPARVAVPMSADAAERWLAADAVDVRGMSPDVAERWLAGE